MDDLIWLLAFVWPNDRQYTKDSGCSDVSRIDSAAVKTDGSRCELMEGHGMRIHRAATNRLVSMIIDLVSEFWVAVARPSRKTKVDLGSRSDES